jgi:hypothetical protein
MDVLQGRLSPVILTVKSLIAKGGIEEVFAEREGVVQIG